MNIKEYPETHQYGEIEITDIYKMRTYYSKGDLGIQIAKDGRIWICIDGTTFLRFKPNMDMY